MATNTIRLVILIAVSQLIAGASCNKKDTSCLSTRDGYSFKVTSEWSPQQAMYNVGDTIFLTSVFSKSLVDQINQSLTIDYSNSVGIGGDIGFAAPDSILRVNKPARDSFKLFAIVGNFIERDNNRNQGINNKYLESASAYEFKAAIICEKKGQYAISVDDLKSRGLNGKNCTSASFNMNVLNSQKNVGFYQSALGITLDNESLKKIFCFRVQ
jgi:hypothetical protein